MDYTIENNSRLFEELIAVLNRHGGEDGALEALHDLKSAKVNYAQRSIDHMLNCLILTIHDLIAHPPSPALKQDLESVIHNHYREIGRSGPEI